eukprot:scaffold231795_cov30-Tisochrysis_lutea.AAC.1
MVKLTAAEYQACWQERIEKEDRAFLEATLKDHGDKASKLQSSEVGSQLGSKLDAGPSPGSVLGSAIGSQLGSDKRSSLSGATESIISSHVSSASVSMRKIELLKKQLEQVCAATGAVRVVGGTHRQLISTTQQPSTPQPSEDGTCCGSWVAVT